MRSSRGPDNLRAYLCRSLQSQEQASSRSPANPQGHGSVAFLPRAPPGRKAKTERLPARIEDLRRSFEKEKARSRAASEGRRGRDRRGPEDALQLGEATNPTEGPLS